MLFQRKYERMKAFQKERLGESPPALEDVNLEDKLEKNDTKALIISALITIVPVALVFLLVICAVGWFFLVR